MLERTGPMALLACQLIGQGARSLAPLSLSLLQCFGCRLAGADLPALGRVDSHVAPEGERGAGLGASSAS